MKERNRNYTYLNNMNFKFYNDTNDISSAFPPRIDPPTHHHLP